MDRAPTLIVGMVHICSGINQELHERYVGDKGRVIDCGPSIRAFCVHTARVDLDISLEGAFFHDADGFTGLSKFGLIFQDSASEMKWLAAMVQLVRWYPEGKTGAADHSERINLAPRRFIEAHFRASIAKELLQKVDAFDLCFLCATIGSKRSAKWKLGEKRDGKWQRA